MKNAPSNKDEMGQFKIKKAQRPRGFGDWHIDPRVKERVYKRK